MPELPEVETTRRGLEPHVSGKKIEGAAARRALRWPVSENLPNEIRGCILEGISRRGKYLLFDCGKGTLILHLGMSGSLRYLKEYEEPGKHDHFDLNFTDGSLVRLRDPRRFGAVIWERGDALSHPLLKSLGIEPLDREFSGKMLYELSRGRSIGVKQFLMDHHVVVGVGNIYANEALYRARISPLRAAGKIGLERYMTLAEEVRSTLCDALEAGGSSL
ncbi:MAG TPA: bifunctional DNA-formamidopyrimidine glycosylase/DNA-(apurinic or apyrimidinic site) lyase, partial [Burkholderiales bacterium]|nr:bifunctional DNA-formamidopyrimidine glycosylase/DNA-(apurinic or apyrimidinic site) lyase [Burkholderiales bacterium]